MKLISLDRLKTFLSKLNSLVVHKAGAETVTGAKTFTAETNVTYPTDSQYIIPFKVQCPSMTDGHGIYINLGKEGSQYNRFSFGFQYKGNHNRQNAFTFSAFAQGTAYSFDAAGNANFPTSLTVPKINGLASKATADASGNNIVNTYATKSAIPTKTSQLTNDSGYLTAHQDLSAYALKTDVPTIPTKVSAFTNDAGYLTSHQDLSAYALKTDIPTIPTKVSAFTNDAGYLTSHQDLSAYAKTADVVHNTGAETITGAKTFGDGITSTTIKSDSIVTGLKGTHYFQCRKFRGEGDASTYYHAIDFGYSGHNQVDFHEYGGTWNFYMNQDGLSTSGTLVGSIQPDGWHGNVIGNASSATKATQDGSGNVIVDTYATKAEIPTVPVKGIKVSGSTSNLTADDNGVVTIPYVPSRISYFDNDAGYLTSHQDLSAYAKKTDIPTVPTNVSAFTNDAGYLTAHQDLSKYQTKLTFDTTPTSLSANPVTSGGIYAYLAGKYALRTSIPVKTSQLTNDSGYLTAHQDISGKADKATTLAGYGITDAYTSTEVDSKIKAAIGAIADYDSTAF